MRPARSRAVLVALALMAVSACGDEDSVPESAPAATGTSTPATVDDTDGAGGGCDDPSAVEPGAYEHGHTHAGVEQANFVVVPETYESGTPAHLYIVVPGGSGSAEGALMGWGPNLVGVDALVVFPELGHPASRTVPMMRALIDDVADTYCIDRSRVYATGTSASAGFTSRLMADASDVIAAFAPGIGRFPTTGLEPIGPVPLIAWSGDIDRAQVELSVAEWAAANGCTAEPTVSDLGSGIAHHHYEGCAAPTEYYYFAGMGHQVPNHDCSAVGPQYCAEYQEFDFWEEVSRFFDAHPLPAP